MPSMFRSIVALVCLLPGLSLCASEGQKPAYPYFTYQVARGHEIKPHRRQIPVDGIGQTWPSRYMLHLKLTISPTGDVMNAEATGEDETTRFWLQAQGEVYRWKFTPFEVGGKAVTAEVQEFIDFVPPERLPKRHIPPPAITKDSKVTIALQRWGCNGAICPAHTVTMSGNQIVFEGFGDVVAEGRHTDKIDKDAVIALAERFAAADFYSMEDEYRGMEDTPSSVLSITIDGHTKIVKNYDGPWVGMPSVILELEDEVDTLARSKRWIEGGDGLVAALRAEKFDFASHDAQLIMAGAAAGGQTATIRELLEAGVRVKPVPAPKIDNPYGSPPREVRFLTVASGYPDTLQVFLDLGASKDDQDEKDRALNRAAGMGKLQAVRALIAYGANPNADLDKLWDTNNGAHVLMNGMGAGSVLISAAESGNLDVVKEILRYGPNLEARERRGRTALFEAGESTNSEEDERRAECVRVLAKAGANVDAQDRDGNTLLHKANLLNVDEELLKLGANVNARNHAGETPIFTNMNIEALPLFLKYGADLTVRNNRGETAIDARTGRGPDWDEALRKVIAEREHRP